MSNTYNGVSILLFFSSFQFLGKILHLFAKLILVRIESEKNFPQLPDPWSRYRWWHGFRGRGLKAEIQKQQKLEKWGSVRGGSEENGCEQGGKNRKLNRLLRIFFLNKTWNIEQLPLKPTSSWWEDISVCLFACFTKLKKNCKI